MNTTIWQTIREEAALESKNEPMLAKFFNATIFDHDNISSALSYHLAGKLDCGATSAVQIRAVMEEALADDPSIIDAACEDIIAVKDRDSACDTYSMPFLYFKGFFQTCSPVFKSTILASSLVI